MDSIGTTERCNNNTIGTTVKLSRVGSHGEDGDILDGDGPIDSFGKIIVDSIEVEEERGEMAR